MGDMGWEDYTPSWDVSFMYIIDGLGLSRKIFSPNKDNKQYKNAQYIVYTYKCKVYSFKGKLRTRKFFFSPKNLKEQYHEF